MLGFSPLSTLPLSSSVSGRLLLAIATIGVVTGVASGARVSRVRSAVVGSAASMSLYSSRARCASAVVGSAASSLARVVSYRGARVVIATVATAADRAAARRSGALVVGSTAGWVYMAQSTRPNIIGPGFLAALRREIRNSSPADVRLATLLRDQRLSGLR